MERISVTKYKAFDGTMHDTLEACEEYEREAAYKKIANLKQFDIVFPMQDRVTSCIAYCISSEDEFVAFKEYIDNNFPETYAEEVMYEGNGWYVLEDDHCGYARIDKLSTIIRDWGLVMNEIANHTMDFVKGDQS